MSTIQINCKDNLSNPDRINGKSLKIQPTCKESERDLTIASSNDDASSLLGKRKFNHQTQQDGERVIRYKI